jgi:Flp pilus assembly protein TadD
MLLASGKSLDAAAMLQRATAKNPLPEYQWALADALRAGGRTNEAGAVETELRRTGAANDPRTFALFLATRGEQGSLALRLAESELTERSDVFTHDALAWALFAAGRHTDAWQSMERALAEGTQDARMFLHAGVIAVKLGREDASRRVAQAQELERLLLPSERRHLDEVLRLQSRNKALTAGARVDVR